MKNLKIKTVLSSLNRHSRILENSLFVLIKHQKQLCTEINTLLITDNEDSLGFNSEL